MNKRVKSGFWLLLAGSFALGFSTAPAFAQEMDHSGMDMPDEDCGTVDYFSTPRNAFSEGSGTSRLPGEEVPFSAPCWHSEVVNRPNREHMHIMAGDWMLMLHASASAQYTKATGLRGDDKFYSTSMAMVMAERETDWGRLQFKSMFSLEPAMDAVGYPNLFATGETARGAPLVDRQHPHDFFMELAARIDVNLSDSTRLVLYGGPVGEPALGPSAFMHRGSAIYNPEPPISHHWFDSTHITYGVMTSGIGTDHWQLEASAFRGAEPDERRWNIETPKLDSWSVRGTVNPTPRWALQASYGEIRQPETSHPGENERRFTASAHFDNGHSLAAMVAFSAKKRVPGNTLTAWLAEANWDMDPHNTLFGRIENVSNDELFPDHTSPLHDKALRVTKFQAGYARRIPLGPFELALGGALSAFAKPSVLDTAYGRNPLQYTLFAKLILAH